MDPKYLIVGAALAFSVAVWLIWDWMRKRKAATSVDAQNQAWIKKALQKETTKKPSLTVVDLAQVRAIEHEFNKVFMLTPKENREELIKSWMTKRNCDRVYAMKLATEEWQRENR